MSPRSSEAGNLSTTSSVVCSPSETRQLTNQLRTAIPGLSDPRYTDEYILRFLRARKHDFENTKMMLSAHVAWVNDTIPRLNGLSVEKVAAIGRIYPQGYHGQDKLGRTIYIERLGQLKITELLKVATDEEILLRGVREYERLLFVRMPFTKVSKTMTILDVSGVGLGSLKKEARDFIASMNKMAADNYPELMGQLYIVNAPGIFSALWGAVKVMLDPVTRKKVIILGKNFHQKLSEVVEIDKLPEFLGGKCRCDTSKDETEYFGCLDGDRGAWPGATPLGGADQILKEPLVPFSTNSEPLKKGWFDVDKHSVNIDEFVSVQGDDVLSFRSLPSSTGLPTRRKNQSCFSNFCGTR